MAVSLALDRLEQTNVALDKLECACRAQSTTLGQDAFRIGLGAADDVGTRVAGVLGKRLDRVLADAARAADKDSNEALGERRGDALVGGNGLGKSDHFGCLAEERWERREKRWGAEGSTSNKYSVDEDVSMLSFVSL